MSSAQKPNPRAKIFIFIVLGIIALSMIFRVKVAMLGFKYVIILIAIVWIVSTFTKKNN